MLVAVLGPKLILFVWSSIRYERFDRYITESGGPVVHTSMFRTTQDWSVPDWSALGTQLPVPHDPSKLLLVTYATQVLGTQPRMQLRLGWRFQPTPASQEVYLDGNPPIVCNLSADQAESLMQHGVPETLLDAMLNASKSAGWPASLPPTGPGGFITLRSSGAQLSAIPPDPHF